MATRIVMPTFGMYTAEGVLARWLVEAGSVVETGDLVAEITTEKASYEIEAPADGILHPHAAVGDPLTVEGLIGWILAEGEEPPVDEGATEPAKEPAPDERSEAAAADTASVVAAGSQRGPTTVIAPPTTARATRTAVRGPGGERLHVTPAARVLAAANGVALATLRGSGPGGRIVEADVRAAILSGHGGQPSAVDQAPAPAAAQAPVAAEERYRGPGAVPHPLPWKVRERTPFTGLRRAIADRLRRTADTAVSLTLTRQIDAAALVAARPALAERLGVALPWDALFIKGFADALRARPELNAVIHQNDQMGDELVLLDEVHVGFAVSLPAGLMVPVVRNPDERPLAEVVADMHELVRRARAGALVPGDVLGGTATISNLGAQGIDAFTPVLNPPQSAILGIGRIAARPVVDQGGNLAVGQTCVLSLTFDHRVADGVPAAGLLAAVARRVESASWLEGLVEA